MAEKVDEKVDNGSAQSGLNSPPNGVVCESRPADYICDPNVPSAAGPPTLRDLLHHARISRARETHGEDLVA